MEFLAGLICFAAVIALMVSIVALVWPIKRIGLGTRKRAALALVGSLVAATIGGSLAPNPPAVAAGSAKKSASAAVTEKPAGALVKKEEVQALWSDLKGTVARCDTLGSKASDTMEAIQAGKMTAYDGYAVADQAHTECQAAWLAVSQLSPPKSAKGEMRDGFEKALQACKMAYFAKSEGYETLGKIFDGDARPSVVGKFKSDMDDYQSAQIGCVAGLMGQAAAAGVELPEAKKS